MYTIFELIAAEMKKRNDSIDAIVATTHSVNDFKCMNELSAPQGFTIWTSKMVYFPSSYESQYNIESVPRNPCDEDCGVMY